MTKTRGPGDKPPSAEQNHRMRRGDQLRGSRSMLGVGKQDNVTVHCDQMRPQSCRSTRRKQNAVHPSPSRGRQAQSCPRQFLQATPAQSISDRPCDGIWQHTHLVVVSDNKLFLTTLSHGQAAGIHNDVREPRRHDVRIQVELVEENLAVAELVQGRVWNRSTHRRDEDHVPRSMCPLSEGVQLVLTPVEIHVDGKTATGIVALRKIGDIRANQ